MDAQQLIREARAGKFAPVHVIVGPERFLAERAVTELRAAVVDQQTASLNTDLFQGKSAVITRVVEAARTLPMMGRNRFVLLRGVDSVKPEQLAPLVHYFETATPTTCLVLTAEKLDGRSRLAIAAKKRGYWVEARALRIPDVRRFAHAEAKRRGHDLESEAGAWLVDAIGNDLGAIEDALERLSLYVGAGAPIDVAAVEACVSRIRVESVWTLVDAVAARDARAALHAASSLLGHQEPPLRILALVARQLRMVARTRHGLASGLSPDEACKAAGAPPFKTRELATAARRFRDADLARAFRVLAETDMALKSSRRPPQTVLMGAISELCWAG